MMTLVLAALLCQDAPPPPAQEDPIKAFLKRFECCPGCCDDACKGCCLEQLLKHKPATLKMDGAPLLQVGGKKVECGVEGEGDSRALVVKIDGKEFSRVPLPKLDLKPADLPPLALKNIDEISTKCQSQSINGKSSTKVWVDGKLVYDGPGTSSKSTVKSENGKKFVEVIVDDKVVYRVGEGKGAEPEKLDK